MGSSGLHGWWIHVFHVSKLPAVGSSGHAAVLMQASNNPNYEIGTDIVVSRRVCDHNSKVLLAHELANINWSALYQMKLCEDMLTYFYNTVLTLYCAYAPVCSFKRHLSDKPWVTDRFRQLIRCRQFAFQTGNMTAYKKYRNAAHRLGKKLRQQYYNKQVSRLRQSSFNISSHSWRWTQLFPVLLHSRHRHAVTTTIAFVRL